MPEPELTVTLPEGLPARSRRKTRVYRTNAEKQAAYRKRRELVMGHLQHLRDALCAACERGRSARLTNHLPEEPQAWMPELTRRLEGVRLIVATRQEAPSPSHRPKGKKERGRRSGDDA
ncbi:MAG TPA: hypothetical protein VFU47_05570 [Armatimonadota bacterium]|nr:hypothetical protein [Armatimonadota bacterium]